MRARTLGAQHCDKPNNGAEHARRHVYYESAEKCWVIGGDGYPKDDVAD
jgi:hypothetical protein